MPENLWPAGTAGFRRAGYGLYQAWTSSVRRLLSALALHMDLPETFRRQTDAGNSILPDPLSADRRRRHPERARRRARDINLITLLVGASAKGLEAVAQGAVVPFTAADTIVVNIGDMLRRLTNHYPSTTHRVVSPITGRKGAQTALFHFFTRTRFPDRRAAAVDRRGQSRPISPNRSPRRPGTRLRGISKMRTPMRPQDRGRQLETATAPSPPRWSMRSPSRPRPDRNVVLPRRSRTSPECAARCAPNRGLSRQRRTMNEHAKARSPAKSPPRCSPTSARTSPGRHSERRQYHSRIQR